MFSFGSSKNGRVGIAFVDGGVTIGYCGWNKGHYSGARVIHVNKNPRDFTADDWRSACNTAGISGSDCAISLPMSMLHHQILRLPEMNNDELQEAASWEMAERFGIDKYQLQTDAIRVGTGGDVLAIAIEKDVLEALLNPIYAAGLRPSTVEPHCLSVTRTFSMLHRRQSDKGIVRSVFDFGEFDSAFMIMDGDQLMFYKHFTYCGKDLVEAIETHTGVTKEQAILMLNSNDASSSDPSINQAVRDASRSLHDAIATDVMKCQRHYGVTNRGPLSACMYITGSYGWNQHLGEVLNTACNQDILTDITATHISKLGESICSTCGWHIALGVSLTNLQSSQNRRGGDPQVTEAA